METNLFLKNKLNNLTNENENLNINNNNIITQKNSKIQSSKPNNQIKQNKGINLGSKKNDDGDDFVLPVKTFKRSNSIKLYKKQQKDKQKRDFLNNESIKDVKNDNIVHLIPENNDEKRNKSTQKKVSFCPDFVTIIDVESYKKFNEENTCKDPFDDMEFLNGKLNLNIKDEEEDGKAKVQCSCSVF
jgi:hypothetical protein